MNNPSFEDLFVSEDDRTARVKLADLLHNVRTLKHMNRSHQVRRAIETLLVYAPLANRLGLTETCDELVKLASDFLYGPPDDLSKKMVEEVISLLRKMKGELDDG